MSNLFLVRHGQASFLEPDYDRLSPKGETQSRLLGEYWANHKVVFDHAYSGPRIRQRETARIAGETYKKAGLPWPEPEILDQFDAFSAQAVLQRSLPHFLETAGYTPNLHAAFHHASCRAKCF